ncbi:nitroreductase/quinone reductase family protein [Micromonospora maritima]|uniref:nitroreductase/quinone reductase family protein n=1 Tax=Micromonospora maritima TaxID=986711 RepID=UPI00157C76BD|nr:nitroreductase/quinone reductase family protein [Micromonospora maritima]
MRSSPRPPVQRVRPPQAPYRLVNRVVRWLLATPARSGRLGRHLMLLHLTGRRTGRELVFPVAYRQGGDGRLLVLTNSGWRVNLRGRPDVEVTLRGQLRPARAELVEDPDRVATVYRALIEAAGHRRAGRRMGIRINVPRTPTHDELADAARRDGLALVHLDVRDVRP